MTTPSTARKAGPFTGNGSQTSWPFTFKVFSAADIRVTAADANGVETVLVLNSDYTVSLNSNQESSPGGSVSYLLPSGNKLSITGALGYDQPLDVPTGGNFNPVALENQLDRMVMQTQQLAEQMDRAVRVPVTEGYGGEISNELATGVVALAPIKSDITAVAGISASVTAAAQNVADINNFADVYQGGSAAAPATRGDGSALREGDLYYSTSTKRMRVFNGSVWVDAVADAGVYRVDRFNGTGAQTAFTLGVAPATANNTQVYISGVYQQKNRYTVAGTTLTFLTAPPAGTGNIEVVTISTMAVGIPAAAATDVAFSPAGTGAVVRTAQDKMREIVSVKDFGAVGDGVNDDTAEIQAAIDYLQSLGALSAEGKKLWFPAGFYKLSAPLNISDLLVIQGDGAESTKLQITTGVIFDVSSAGVEFRDLFFVGPSVSNGNGIRLTNGNNCIIERCTFQNQTTGIELNSSYAVEVIGCIFDVCYTYGVYSSTSCHNLIIDRCGFFTCGVQNLGHAVNIAAASDNLNFLNNDFEYCNVNIRLNACNSVQITGNYMEYHYSECFDFVGANTGIIIESNWIALGQSAGGGDTLTIQNITGGRFQHNTIYNQSVNASPAAINGFTFGLNRKTGTGTYDPSVWISPTLQNSWAQQTNYSTVGYYKDENGWVYLRGGLVGGVAPNVMFTLPVGYRPSKIAIFGTDSASGPGRITVNTDGTVVPTVAASNNAGLDGIMFFVG